MEKEGETERGRREKRGGERASVREGEKEGERERKRGRERGRERDVVLTRREVKATQMSVFEQTHVCCSMMCAGDSIKLLPHCSIIYCGRILLNDSLLRCSQYLCSKY